MTTLFATIGGWVLGFLHELGALTKFFGKSVQAVFRPPFYWRQIPAQMYQIGIRSLPVLITVSLFVGMTLAIQGDIAFRQVGATGMLGIFCALAEFREMCPIMAAAMVCAKAGSEIAAHLGTMRVKEQIDAMEVMAVNSFSYLVAPRFLAALLIMPMMVIVANITAITASFAVAVFQLHQDRAVFISQVYKYVEIYDFVAGICKGFFFGIVLAVVCCYYGYHAGRGAAGVGEATNKAVVYSATACVVLNLFLTEFLYG